MLPVVPAVVLRLVPRLVLMVLPLACLPGLAQRDPVLKQIDLPHRYYYREMYLPQLTTGPSAAAWLPDSRSLVYSMAGSLWRQEVDSERAQELTAGPGYDYQPDCSPDGRWVVFVKYDKDAMELWALDLLSVNRGNGKPRQLTSGGAVNVDARFSPDGKRIAFVSTSYKGHFHIFAGDFKDGELTNVQRLTGETRSDLPRFYYSEFDHEISPAWSPDGRELIYVSNRGHIYGTGGFWRMKAECGAGTPFGFAQGRLARLPAAPKPSGQECPLHTSSGAHEIHYEETAWKARPEFSPDGKRIVYASYLGGQWHQLWTMPSAGGDAFPLSYGDFDNTNPRWSPDASRIAFISNRGGNTSLWIQEAVGGAQRPVIPKHKSYLRVMGYLSITVLNEKGEMTPARISVTGEDGRAYAPEDAWMHAEDNFVRAEGPFESHYFHTSGNAEVTVPAAMVEVEVVKGFEYQVEKRVVPASVHTMLNIQLKPLDIPREKDWQWLGADLHVHMNYGGAYRNTPANLIHQQQAEGLFLVENLVVNKEQRIPDIAYFQTTPDAASTASAVLAHGQEFHTSYWGHLGLLGLQRNFLLPGYASYGNTSAASLFPTNAAVADLAHAQQGLVGYVHPFDIPMDPVKDPTLTSGQPLDEALELPVDVALGKVDYIEAMGFSDHRFTAEVWYRLLNCGFRLPTGAGSDTMANYASLRGPVGLTRVYAQVPKEAPQGAPKLTDWMDALKHGRTFATNGPLLGFTLGGKVLGEELKVPAGESKIPFKAWMRSMVPVDRLEVVCNGRVVRELKLGSDGKSGDGEDAIPISRSGWCLLRASSERPEHPVLDDYVYATTSPIYVIVGEEKTKSTEDAAFFLTWIDRLEATVRKNQDWNRDEEKVVVLKTLDQARQVYAAQK